MSSTGWVQSPCLSNVWVCNVGDDCLLLCDIPPIDQNIHPYILKQRKKKIHIDKNNSIDPAFVKLFSN